MECDGKMNWMNVYSEIIKEILFKLDRELFQDRIDHMAVDVRETAVDAVVANG